MFLSPWRCHSKYFKYMFTASVRNIIFVVSTYTRMQQDSIRHYCQVLVQRHKGLAVDLRPQRIQSHSSNSIITAMDSKHVAIALSVSLYASPSLFLSLFFLLIDLRPQRIESHSLKTPLSCATNSKSHRENTYRKCPKKSL